MEHCVEPLAAPVEAEEAPRVAVPADEIHHFRLEAHDGGFSVFGGYLCFVDDDAGLVGLRGYGLEAVTVGSLTTLGQLVGCRPRPLGGRAKDILKRTKWRTNIRNVCE